MNQHCETPIATMFRHCPACGTPRGEEVLSPFCCEACGFRFFFGPVTAVAGLVCDDDGRLLFVRRARDPGQGLLGLPGGFVDAGESLENALVREVREETNLLVSASVYLTSEPNSYVYRGAALPVTDMFFVCRVESFEPMRATDGEVTELILTGPTEAELNQMAFPSNRSAVEQYVRQVREKKGPDTFSGRGTNG